ncbi:MAG: stage V sporulation protein T [Lachnospiraceae bacterium]|jgi:AbrB family transcriptional regulator (stage V sporulation protein T)|nr:stage V sporulation protein T [Lachnospiraceae bacterium]
MKFGLEENAVKATGIVRRIDDLGRVVIPKEIRRTLRIRESDPLEIFTNNEGAIILKKYSPIGELGSFAKQYAESLSQVSGHVALIADRDQFIAAAGSNSKQILGKNVSKELEEKMNSRETVCASRGEKSYIGVMDNEVEEYQHEVIIPIITQGDIIGAVVLLSTNEGDDMDEVEMKLAQSAAGFLGKQMEQ